jgi:hypothetical protein
MQFLAGTAACIVIGLVLFDAFNTVILVRRSPQSFRITRAIYWLTWRPFAALGGYNPAKDAKASSVCMVHYR